MPPATSMRWALTQPKSSARRAAITGLTSSWSVAGRRGRVWCHPCWPDGHRPPRRSLDKAERPCRWHVFRRSTLGKGPRLFMAVDGWQAALTVLIETVAEGRGDSREHHQNHVEKRARHRGQSFWNDDLPGDLSHVRQTASLSILKAMKPVATTLRRSGLKRPCLQ